MLPPLSGSALPRARREEGRELPKRGDLPSGKAKLSLKANKPRWRDNWAASNTASSTLEACKPGTGPRTARPTLVINEAAPNDTQELNSNERGSGLHIWHLAELLCWLSKHPNTLRTAPWDAEAAAPSSHEGQGRSMQ